jgi:diacylglycerol kinase family enzyme
MPGLGIISNPFAKINKRDPEHNTLLWYILGNRGQFEITNSLHDLSRVCEEFCSRGIDTIGIVGGDGTVSLTLSAIAQAYPADKLPRILVLRGGTVNVLAANLGIFGRPKDVFADALEAYHMPNGLAQMSLQTLKVNGRLGFIFADGVAARFLGEFYKNKSSTLGAGLFLSKVIADGTLGGHLGGAYKQLYATDEITINCNPRPWPHSNPTQAAIIAASTIPKMPFGVKLFRNLNTRREEAELLVVKAGEKELPFRILNTLLRQGKFAENFASSHVFSEAVLKPSKEIEYSLDGDLLEPTDQPIHISLGPRFVFCSPYGTVL